MDRTFAESHTLIVVPVGNRMHGKSKVEKAIAMMNGDTRGLRISHYEKNCGRCATRAEAVDNLYAVLVEACVLPSPNAVLAAGHRFGSTMESTLELVSGRLVYGNLTLRLLYKANPKVIQCEGCGLGFGQLFISFSCFLMLNLHAR